MKDSTLSLNSVEEIWDSSSSIMLDKSNKYFFLGDESRVSRMSNSAEWLVFRVDTRCNSTNKALESVRDSCDAVMVVTSFAFDLQDAKRYVYFMSCHNWLNASDTTSFESFGEDPSHTKSMRHISDFVWRRHFHKQSTIRAQWIVMEDFIVIKSFPPFSI